MKATKLFLGILLGYFGMGGVLQAAVVTIAVDYAGVPFANSQGSVIASGAGSVQIGAFYNEAGSAFYTTGELAAVWATKNKAAYDALSAAFVPLVSGSFTASGGFAFYETPDTIIDLPSGNSVDLGGKQVFVFANDNQASPTNFAILAVNQSMVGDFLDPAFPSGEGLDNQLFLEINNSSERTTSIVGMVVGSQFRMEAVPSSAPAAPVLNGLPNVTTYWGSAYSDAGATSSSAVSTVIRDAANAVVADFSTMAATLGTYTVTYTSNGLSVSRTVTVKLATPLADGDHDGLPDLMEYALGGSLTTNDSAKLPVATVSGNELILTFTSRVDVGNATQVALGFLSTTSLGVPFAAEALTKKSGVSAGSRNGINYETQQWSLPTTGIPKKFVRVNFTVPAGLSGS